MHHINKEVNIVLNQVIEELCNVSCHKKIQLSPKYDQHTENIEFSDLFSNNDESKLKKFSMVGTSSQKILVPDISGNVFEKWKKITSDSTDSLCDASFNNNVVNNINYPPKATSMPILLTENEAHYENGNDSLDEAIDKAFIKYETYEENSKKLRNVSVQTMCQMEMTADKQCQCDISVDNCMDAYPLYKQVKLNDYCYCLSFRNTQWKFGQPEEENKDMKTKCFESGSEAIQIKTSRIRIGLSKRVRPSPLHVMH